MSRSKITVVGAGRVGSNVAMLCVQRELGNVVLWNRTGETAKGIALDIMESSPTEDADASITGTVDWKDTAGSDVVVITAGLPRKPGMTRADLLNTNANIVKSAALEIKKRSKDAVVVVVTNPLDAMAYVALRATGFPRERIVGMAGVLDASRFRTFIARELDVSVEDVLALVLGGHGDSMVPLSRHASVGGIPLPDVLSQKRIAALEKHTREAGTEIIALEKEGSAFYAPADAVAQMVEAIVRDKKRVLPCSAYVKGEYGYKDVYLGVPVVLGSGGVERIIEVKLNAAEKKALARSAADVKAQLKELKL